MTSDISKLGLDVKWQDLTLGCTVVGSCTAAEFHTGEWRTDTPKFIEEKCKQCLLCATGLSGQRYPDRGRQAGRF